MKKGITYLGLTTLLICFIFGMMSAKAPTKTGVLMVKMNPSNIPSGFEALKVEIKSVELNYGNFGTSGADWIELVSNLGIYDLMDYRTTAIVLSNGLEIGTGKIAQIKINFGQQNSVVIGDRPYALKLAKTDGVVIDLSKVIDELDHVEVILNIDVAKSITMDNQESFSFNPSIRMSSILPFK